MSRRHNSENGQRSESHNPLTIRTKIQNFERALYAAGISGGFNDDHDIALDYINLTITEFNVFLDQLKPGVKKLLMKCSSSRNSASTIRSAMDYLTTGYRCVDSASSTLKFILSNQDNTDVFDMLVQDVLTDFPDHKKIQSLENSATDDCALFGYIEGLDENGQRNCLKAAIGRLNTNMVLVEQTHLLFPIKQQLWALHAAIDAQKDNVPVADLPIFAEFMHRAALSVKDPVHMSNNRRFLVVVDQISGYSKSKFMMGIALLIIGVALIAAAVFLGMAAAGVSTPLSMIVAWAGKGVIGYGTATTLGSVGIASCVSGGFFTKSKHLDLIQPARAILSGPRF